MACINSTTQSRDKAVQEQRLCCENLKSSEVAATPSTLLLICSWDATYLSEEYQAWEKEKWASTHLSSQGTDAVSGHISLFFWLYYNVRCYYSLLYLNLIFFAAQWPSMNRLAWDWTYLILIYSLAVQAFSCKVK